MKNNLIVRLVLIGAVLLVAGYLATLFPWLPAEASAESRATDNLFRIMILIGTAIFLIVEGGLVYSILRFRKKPNDETDGPPIHGSTTLEIVWTAIPAVIVLYLSIVSFQVFAQTQTARDNELVVKVRGYQFNWEFQYEHDPAKQFRPADKLVLPVNRAVRFEIVASDVMHGFWIPEFRIKQDAVPGRVTEVRALPIEKGDYSVVCYELCGSGHGVMRNVVQVVDQSAYDEFIASLEIKPPTAPGPDGSPEWGKYLIQTNKYACGGCHYLPDAGVAGVTGPTWVGIGDRAGTRVPNQTAPTYIQHSILYTNEFIVPGYPANVMPQNYSALMNDEDLNSIVKYLLEQKANPAQAAQKP